MNDFDTFVKEQLTRKGVAREYYRLSPFYRLADQLVLLRKKRGLTQQELAEKASTTQAVVSRLENVSVHCALETVVRLADALDAVVEVRITPTEELAQTTEANQSIVSLCEDKPTAVYFGRDQKKPCPNMMWAKAFDPQTQSVVKETQKRKIKELA